MVISTLTTAQRRQISTFQEKWRAIARRPGNESTAKTVVMQVYRTFGVPVPRVVTAESPFSAIALMKHQPHDTWLDPGWAKCRNLLWQELLSQLSTAVNKELWSHFVGLSSSGCWGWLVNEISHQLRHETAANEFDISKIIRIEEMTAWAAQLDFCQSVLGCTLDPDLWELLSQSVIHCYWVLATDDLCVVCDRPRAQRYDERGLPHAIGQPAIEFANGTGVYAYHGIRLPEAYGKVPVSEWRSHWIIDEPNAELRRILIQEIGYARICEELDTTIIDSWEGYNLLCLDTLQQVHPPVIMRFAPFSPDELETFAADNGLAIETDEFGLPQLVRPGSTEPIHILSMTCPSTGSTHVMRVPPTVQTARDAIRWVNQGIDPEEFAVQT